MILGNKDFVKTIFIGQDDVELLDVMEERNEKLAISHGAFWPWERRPEPILKNIPFIFETKKLKFKGKVIGNVNVCHHDRFGIPSYFEPGMKFMERLKAAEALNEILLNQMEENLKDMLRSGRTDLARDNILRTSKLIGEVRKSTSFMMSPDQNKSYGSKNRPQMPDSNQG
jgi:hypothetical protein